MTPSKCVTCEYRRCLGPLCSSSLGTAVLERNVAFLSQNRSLEAWSKERRLDSQASKYVKLFIQSSEGVNRMTECMVRYALPIDIHEQIKISICFYFIFAPFYNQRDNQSPCSNSWLRFSVSVQDFTDRGLHMYKIRPWFIIIRWVDVIIVRPVRVQITENWAVDLFLPHYTWFKVFNFHLYIISSKSQSKSGRVNGSPKGREMLKGAI